MADPAPFLRGNRFRGVPDVPYPRADARDADRLPADTWGCARLPVTVRLELVGDAAEVELAYRTATDDLGYRGAGAGTTFALWRGDQLVDEQAADLGEAKARLSCHGGVGGSEGRAVVYLPEGMRPEVLDVTPIGGDVEPAPAQPPWTAYGDSVAEGWVASGPAGAWPAIAGRQLGLDVANLGYAGSARGEIVSAEHVAAIDADVITVTHGTNCWTRVPHSVDQMRANTAAFLAVVRERHPDTPVVVVSPVVRPDAEDMSNKLGATLGDLRRAMEEATQARIDAGDACLTLLSGADILRAEHLADGIHPGDEGHRILADVIGEAVSIAMSRVPERGGGGG